MSNKVAWQIAVSLGCGVLLSILLILVRPDSTTPQQDLRVTQVVRIEHKSDDLPTSTLPKNLGLKSTSAGVDQVSQFVKISEILGPLAPLAMSPFFGITVLSGFSQFSGESMIGKLIAQNQLIANSPVLRHPVTFWVFLLLTMATSLPRLTKITKPVAQALDWVESYSGLLTSLVIFGVGMVMMDDSASVPETIRQASILSLTVNAFLLVAATFNFIVVKSVRFFFEMLIWISPVPLIDAGFEVANKSICLGLLTIYAFSPTLALFINLAILVVCLFIFNWAQRRLKYHWCIWLEPFVQWVFPKYNSFDGKNLWVFCEQDFPPFRQYDRLHLYQGDGQWVLMRYDLFWRRAFRTFTYDDLPMIETGPLKNSIILQQQEPVRFSFHRGYSKDLEKIANDLAMPTTQRVAMRTKRLIDEADAAKFEGDPEVGSA